jgi:hypothetical protein
VELALVDVLARLLEGVLEPSGADDLARVEVGRRAAVLLHRGHRVGEGAVVVPGHGAADGHLDGGRLEPQVSRHAHVRVVRTRGRAPRRQHGEARAPRDRPHRPPHDMSSVGESK